jgi:membrane fusion protein, heavy metal efflux system
MASGDHGADHQVEEEPKGPNGGKLLESDGFRVEVTIFEKGIPPEMRLYVYKDSQLIDPKLVKIDVTLRRLGGVQDQIDFAAEGDYLVGNREVVEPHSFDVELKANYQGKNYSWNYENHEGRAVISDRLLALSKIETEKVSAKTLIQKDTLFGVISVPDNKLFNLHAAYPGLVKTMRVKVGDKVKKGQVIATLLNTQTLQNYSLISPSDGEVSGVFANVGEKAENSALVEVTDLSEVWVDLSAFPENIERLAIGQKIELYDLHQHQRVSSSISYIAPKMTGGHIARARAIVSNQQGHWRPGMHIKADIEISQSDTEMAVRTSAIQSFRDMPVVFAKFGSTFEVRMVELGDSDGEYIEVLGGIAPGTEYVTSNSFLLKAEVLKDGASHDH